MRARQRSHSSNHNCNNHLCKPSDFGANNNGKFVYDPGGPTLNIKHDARCDDGDSTSTSNASHAADVHHSFDRDRNKISSISSDADAVPPNEFAQATPVPDVRSPRSTDNHDPIPHHDSGCADAMPLPLSPQLLLHPLDFDSAHSITSDITHTPQDRRFDPIATDADTSNSNNNFNNVSLVNIARTFNADAVTSTRARATLTTSPASSPPSALSPPAISTSEPAPSTSTPSEPTPP